MHAHIYIQCTRGGWNESLVYSPPRPKPRKAWHGLSNQGVAKEHDEQYQMQAGT
jgi:hypothetical protein